MNNATTHGHGGARIISRVFLHIAGSFVLAAIVFSTTVFSAAGVPKIINFQGRLLDSSGNLLGGSGTNYCFRFSLYDDASVGAPDNQLWPAGTPSTMTIPVQQGVFDASIGDTAAGGDALTYNFQDSDSVYVNVQVAAQVAGSCSGVSFENLAPRQRVTAAAYAINSGTVGGFTPSQSATGNQIPALTAGGLILGDTNPAVSATGANALTLQSGATGDINFFSNANKITSSGALTIAGLLTSANIAITNLAHETTNTNAFIVSNGGSLKYRTAVELLSDIDAESASNKSTNTSLGTSDTLYPTQNAVKTYVDNAIVAGGGYTDTQAQNAVGGILSAEFTYDTLTPSISINSIDASKITGTKTSSFISDFTSAVQSLGDARYPQLSGSYANPSWISSLAWSKITGTPTTLAGYGITDALSNSSTSTQDGYFGNIALQDDTSPSHYLTITDAENLTANHTLSLNSNNGDRTISLSGNLTVPAAATVSGTNTGDVTLAGENYLSISGQVITANAVDLSGTNVTGTLAAARFPALTGDVTTTAGSVATTIASNAVTYAKFQQVAASSLVGNPTGSLANASGITLGAGLSFSGTTLVTSAIPNASLANSTIALALGTSGTNANVSGSPVALGGTITLNLPTASATNTGLLSNTDWSTFNGKENVLTFSTGLTRSVNTITVNTTQNIAKLSNLTTNGFVKTSGGDGTLSIDTSTYLTANQTITLSGDVSGSGTTAITTAIGANKVLDSMLRQGAATSIIGRATGTIGNVADIAASADNQVLYRSGGALTFGTLPNAALTNSSITVATGTSGTDVNVSGSPVALGGTLTLNIPDANNTTARGLVSTGAQTFGGAKTFSSAPFLTSVTDATGNFLTLNTVSGLVQKRTAAEVLSDIGAQPTGNYITALTGDATASGPGSAALTIASNAVTFAKFQTINTGKLLGRSTAGTGNAEEIAVGSGLSISGGTLSATGSIDTTANYNWTGVNTFTNASGVTFDPFGTTAGQTTEIRFKELAANGTEYVALKAPDSIVGSIAWTLPDTDSAGCVQSDGSGHLTIASCTIGGGGGTVTNFAAGNLSPLFTTSVSNPSTTPALSFSLSNAAANTWFGNNTASLAAPAYNAAGALTKTDDTNVTLTLGGSASTALLNDASITVGWTGQLAVGRGGTGAGSFTTNGVLYGNNTSAIGVTAAGTDGQLLLGVTSGAPTFATLSGDATITNAGVLSIGANKITNALLRQSAGLSVIGRSVNTTGNIADITGTADQILRVSGTTLGFGSIDLSQAAAVGTSILAGANGGTGVANSGKTITLGGNISTAGAFTTAGAFGLTLTSTALTNVTLPTTGTLATLAGAESLTNKKLGSLTTNGFVKTSGSDGTLSVDTSTYLTGNQTITLSGDVTGSGATAIATTIANNAVTYAKFQQVAASSLVGNPTGSLANASGITLGAGLAFSGTTLVTSAIPNASLANSSITVATGTSGTDVNVSGSPVALGGTLTLNIPDANNTTARGLVSTGAQTFGGAKTFSSAPFFTSVTDATGNFITLNTTTGLIQKRTAAEVLGDIGAQAALSGTGYVKMSGTTPSYVASIPIADLAASTISGVSLGNNLANLTATDTTLTFSGAYNGSTARTVGLNLGNANTWTAAQAISGALLSATATSLGTTQDAAKGFLLSNSTAAAAGLQQISPAIVWTGQGWKTNTTAASQSVSFRADVLPVQGAAAPTGTWQLAASIAGGAYANALTVTSGGNVTATGTITGTNFSGTSSGTNTGDVTLAGENYLSIAGQVITANAVNLSGTNVTGTLAAARFPALTGDVTTTAGSLATTIGANKVLDTMLRQSAGLSIIGRSANTTGNVADITGTADQILRVSGTTLGFGSIDLSQAAAVGTSILAGANGGTGVANSGKTITLGGNISTAGALTTSGAFATTFTVTGTTGVTLPTSGTLYGTASGSISSSQLATSLSDETGSGKAVFDTAPTFATTITLTTSPTASAGGYELLTRNTTTGVIEKVASNTYLTGNQTITLSGDVTGSGATAIATTIASNAVTYAKFQQVAASSLVGNPTGSLANASGITLGAGLAFSGTTLVTSAIPNSSLANSTISGVALGGTLFGLSATNSTLTFSGTYTGAAAQTVSLNLGNANTWTAKQTLQLTTEQLRLGYDASNYDAFTVASTGALTIAGTTGSALGVGASFNGLTLGGNAVTEAASGTHALITGVSVSAPAITDGAASTTSAASLYVAGAPTGTATPTNSYAFLVNSGASKFGGTLALGSVSDATGNFLTLNGSTGIVQSRTAAETLADIGAQAALSGTGYVKMSGTTPSYVASIPIADLAASTISGVSLGNNLANLTATDTTLTFSGAYNGSTARTVGLNLGNANTWTATQTFPQIGLAIKGATANTLTIKPNETLTAGRTLSIVTGDADRSLTFSGNATISGTNTGDQTITLTGDVTGSGTGSFVTTIGANKVLDTMLRQSAGLSIIGRSANTTGNVADITGTANQILRVSGTTLGFGSIDLSQAAAVGTSILNVANGGTGVGTLASNGILYGNGTGAIQALAVNTGTAKCLTQASSAAPAWSTCGGAIDGTYGDITVSGSGTVWTVNAGGVLLNELGAAGGTNTIDNGNSTQEWQWNTLAGASGLKLTSTSTAAATNAQKLFEIGLSGANGTAQTTYGSYITNTHTGAGSTNIAGYFSASGATNNYAGIFANGNVGIGDTTPLALLTVGSGDLFQVDASGNTTLQNQASLRLGDADGSNYVGFKAPTTVASNVTWTLPSADGPGCFQSDGLGTVTLGSCGGTLTDGDYGDIIVSSSASVWTIDPTSTPAVAGLTVTNSTDAASVNVATFAGNRATVTNDDEGYISFKLSDDIPSQQEYARLTWVGTNVHDGTLIDGALDLSVVSQASLTKEVRLTGTTFSPFVNDGNGLGTATTSWSDLFLASGAIVNFAAGDVTITHSANALTFGGAANGYLFSDVVRPSSNGAAALGTGTASWSNLFLANAGVINWNNGNVTLTQSTGKLTIGGSSGGNLAVSNLATGGTAPTTTGTTKLVITDANGLLSFSSATVPTGTNTGDVTLAGENYLSISGQVITANAVDLSGTNVTGTLAAARFPALTGDVTTTAGSVATTIVSNAVTYAKFQQVAASSIVGNPTGVLANTQGITLGAGLAFSGTTLVTSAIPNASLANSAITIAGTSTSLGGSITLDTITGVVANGYLKRTGANTLTNVSSIPIADLTASTISGVSLGNNLADLTATDTTLTFSGAYNGGTARTVGLNLGNANTWTAKQTIQLATEQLRLGFDASNYDAFTVGSKGNLTIAGTTATALAANASFTGITLSPNAVTEASSGTHALITGVTINAPVVTHTPGASSTTGATLYITGAPGGTAPIVNNYALIVNSGGTYLNGGLTATGTAVLSGGFQTNGSTFDSGTFTVAADTTVVSSTNAANSLLGSGRTDSRILSRSATTTSINTSASLATLMIGQTSYFEAILGTHPLVSQLAIKPLILTDNTSTNTTNGATLYIEGPATGTATITNNYSFWVDSGVSAFGGNLIPDTNDGAALGTAANSFSDLFLASGGVINFNNGDVTLTHATDKLTLGGGNLVISNLATGGTAPTTTGTTKMVITDSNGLLSFSSATVPTGTNTGDVTLAGENYLSISGQVITANAVDLSGTNVTGTLAAARFPALTGDVTTTAGSLATTIASNAVTYAKFQQVAASSLVGNPTGSLANASGITLGAGLSFSGTTLVTSAIPNASLANSAITIAGTSTSLGGSITLDTITGLASTGLIKRTGVNTLAIATAGTDYENALTFTNGLTRSTNTISLGGMLTGTTTISGAGNNFSVDTTGGVSFGDLAAAGNSTYLSIDDFTQSLTFFAQGGQAYASLDAGTGLFRIGKSSATNLAIDDVGQTFTFNSGYVGIGTTPSAPLDVLNNATGQTSSISVANIGNGGSTFDTTAGPIESDAGSFFSTGTRTAGTNPLTNVGIYVSASGGDNNYAAIFDQGNVGIGDTTPASLFTVGSGDLFQVNSSGAIAAATGITTTGNVTLSTAPTTSAGTYDLLTRNTSTGVVEKVASSTFTSLSGTGYVKMSGTTPSYVASIPIADLAASTISGVSLGNNLANLTATDTTLTFSGAYNGSTARTVGLNLGNANTWTAKQTIQLATEQLRLGYNASNYDSFTVASDGSMTIAGTTGSTLGIGTSFNGLTLGGNAVTEAASGTHALITGVTVNAPVITPASAITTNAAALYVAGAPSGAINNYALMVGSGNSYFSGNVTVGGSFNSTSSTNTLGNFTILVNGGTNTSAANSVNGSTTAKTNAFMADPGIGTLANSSTTSFSDFVFQAPTATAPTSGTYGAVVNLNAKGPVITTGVGAVTNAAAIYAEAGSGATNNYALWVGSGVSGFGGNLIPTTNDGAALGTTTNSFSDLFLASGGVINWNNGDITLTHSAGTLSLSGGTFVTPTLTVSGLTSGRVPFVTTGGQLTDSAAFTWNNATSTLSLSNGTSGASAFVYMGASTTAGITIQSDDINTNSFFKMQDIASGGYMQFGGGASVDFLPMVTFKPSATYPYASFLTIANDTGTAPAFQIDSRLSTGPLTTQPLFGVLSYGGTAALQVNADSTTWFNASILPRTSDGAALGSTTKMFSDLFLASGGIINWNGIDHIKSVGVGDDRMLYANNAGAFVDGGYVHNFNGNIYFDDDVKANADFLATTLRVGNVNNYLDVSGGDMRIIAGTAGTNGLKFYTGSGAVLAGQFLSTGVLSLGYNVIPSVNDGVALGTTANSFSDLFLASGAVINFNNGDVTLTHSADLLTLAGGNLALGSNNITMTGSLAATGARVTKGWFTDIESTNMPTVGGVSLSSTFSPIAGSASITTVGTITSGTWNGGVIAGQYGGTGVANTGKTITLGGNLTTTGAFNTTFAVSGSNTITFPNAAITVARSDAAQSFTGLQTFNGGVTLAANQDFTTTAGTGTLVLNSTVSNASDDAITLTPAFSSTTTGLTYNGFNIVGFSPTNSTGTDTVNGIKIGNLTDPGATVTSSAINLGTGWDTLISGTTAGTNIFSFTNATLTSAGNLTATSFIKSGGTSAQFLKADGSVDSSTYLTANQTITLSGDVTGSGTTAITTALRAGAATSVIGRSAGTSGVVADIAASADNQVLYRSAGALTFGTLPNAALTNSAITIAGTSTALGGSITLDTITGVASNGYLKRTGANTLTNVSSIPIADLAASTITVATGTTGTDVNVSGSPVSLGGTVTINIPDANGTTARGVVSTGAQTFGGAKTFAGPSNTATAFKITDGTNGYMTINTQTGTTAVTALALAVGTAPSIASSATSTYTGLSFTPGTYTFTGTTNTTATGTGAPLGALYNQLTIAGNGTRSITEASNVLINGAVKASSSSGTETITNSYALNIPAVAVNGTNGAVTNAYGLSVSAPTGATNNYAAVFPTGKVGIGTSAPNSLLNVYSTTNSADLLKVMETGAINTNNNAYGVTIMGKNTYLSANYPILTVGDTSQATAYGIALEAKNGVYNIPTIQLGFSGSGGALDMWNYRSWQPSGTDGMKFTTQGSGASAVDRFSISGNTATAVVAVTNSSFQLGNTASSSNAIQYINASNNNAAGGATVAIAGIHEDLTFNPTGGGTQVGNRMVVTNSPTTNANTAVGQIIRMSDGTSLANTVRGIEVVSNVGANTAGVNTGIRTTGATFGIEAITQGTALSVAAPAAVFAETKGTTSGNALRLYTTSLSSENLAKFYQDTSTFTGTGLLMDFANASGTFSGNFVDFRNNTTTNFKVTSAGDTTVHLATSTNNFALCHETNGAGIDQIKDCSNTPTADFAEMYPVESGVEAGDIVAVGPESVNTYDTDATGAIDWNKVKGTISKLVKAASAYQTNTIGIVSDNRSDFTSTGYNLKEQDNPTPIALNGRVPVKIASTSAAIMPGDYLTTSGDEPGKAMKATKAGQVIGKALGIWDPASGAPTVMVFVEPGYYDGAQLNRQVAGMTTPDTDAVATLKDLMAATVEPANLSEINTDRLTAGLEVITPKVVADQVELNGLRAATGTDVALTLSPDGKFVVKNDTGEQTVAFDAAGNATFAGKITATEIEAGSIKGLDAIVTKINLLGEGQEALTLTASAVQTLSQALQQAQTDISGIQTADAATASYLQDLAAGQQGIDSRLAMIEQLFNGDVPTLSISSINTDSLVVAQASTFNGKAEFNGLTFFNDATAFAGDVSFGGHTEFTMPPLFNKDTAGFAVIHAGDRRVKVSFDNEYTVEPVVNTTMTFETNDHVDDNVAGAFFDAGMQSVVVDKDTKGFTILLNKPATRDIRFSWTALAVKDPAVFESIFEGLTIDQSPQITVDPTPAPAPAPTGDTTTPPSTDTTTPSTPTTDTTTTPPADTTTSTDTTTPPPAAPTTDTTTPSTDTTTPTTTAPDTTVTTTPPAPATDTAPATQ